MGQTAEPPIHIDPIQTLSIDSTVEIEIDGIKEKALIDTGAQICVIGEDLANRLGKEIKPWIGKSMIATDGKQLKIRGQCSCKIKIEETEYNVNFVIVEKCTPQLIVGTDFLQQHKAVIDFVNHKIVVEAPQDDAFYNNNAKRNGTFKLKACSNTIFKAHTMSAIEVYHDEETKKPLIVEANPIFHLKTGLAIGRSLIDP